MTTIASIITALGAIIAAALAGYTNLRKLLTPILKRRRFRVAVVASESHDRDARAFAAKLRENGFKDVELTRDPASCLGRQAIVLWHPGEDADRMRGKAQDSAPDATVLALSHDRLRIQLSEAVVACNSQMRLMGDLSSLAELSRGDA